MSSSLKKNNTVASLSLVAINADYAVITQDLYWQITDQHKASKQSTVVSESSNPSFDLLPGTYDLEVTYGNQIVTVADINLVAGERLSQVVIIGGDPKGEGVAIYDLYDDDDFNPDSEFVRRQMERDGQRQYGLEADELIAPASGSDFNYIDPDAQRAAGSMPHPILSNKAQFDGIEAKVNPSVERNPDAAERTLQNRLAAQAKPAYDPGSTPKPSGG